MATDIAPSARAGFTREHADQVMALRDSGRLDEALSAVNVLLQDQPKAQLLHNIKGTIHAERGETDEALAAYREALKIQHTYAAAQNNMGIVLKSLGRFEEAVETYYQALRNLPDYVDAHVNLALAQLAMGMPEQAVARCHKALEISANNAHAHAALANALRQLGRYDEAIASFETALKLRPDDGLTLANLGLTRFEMGEIDAGREDLRRALEVDPRNVDAHYNLGRVEKYESGDPRIEQMQTLQATLPAGASDRIVLNFALAKAFEDTGEIDQAFQHLQDANRSRKAQWPYTPEQDTVLFEKIKATFSTGKQLEPAAAEAGEAARPIFVVGMTRSGTSLVEQIIASHSEVHGAGELGGVTRHLGAQFAKLSDGKALSLNAYKLKALRRAYFADLAKLNVSEPVITDKFPLNFMWIGFIRLAFPEAKIIHVVRDPMATCWSNYKQYFRTTGLGYAYDFDDVADFYGLYADLMAFWRERFGDEIYELNYEALTENQDAETRKLIEWCGLAWEDTCLEFHTSARPVASAAHLEVRQAMYQGSSDKWKTFESHLAPLKQKLGL